MIVSVHLLDDDMEADMPRLTIDAPAPARRRLRAAAVAVAALAGAVVAITGAGPASATPPGIPSKATAQSQLNALTVASEGSMTGYSRDLFPHWITISGTCDTREQVLKRTARPSS
jgi:hypothetical protein